jgi:hypothetical protein
MVLYSFENIKKNVDCVYIETLKKKKRETKLTFHEYAVKYN